MACAAVIPGAARAASAAGVSDTEIVLAQVMDLTGPLAGLTADIANAAKAWFDKVNQSGGINGRSVRLITADDGYVVANTVKVVNDLIEKEKVFAFFNMTGTSNVAAILPRLDQETPPVPIVGMFTGAQELRAPLRRNVFHLRASYADETSRLIEHLDTIGLKRISVLYLDNGFGKDGLAGTEEAMAKHGIKPVAVVPVKQDASDVANAVTTLGAVQQDAIILISAGRVTRDFIKQFSARRTGAQFYCLSVMGAQATVHALGSDGVGVVVVSVVPFPWSRANAVASEYRRLMQAAGHSEVSFAGLESFLNAKVVTEVLRRAGRDLTRTRFIESLEGMDRFDLGGVAVGFNRSQHVGSRFVDLTIIGTDRKFKQ